MRKFNSISSTKVPSSEHDFYFITDSFERLKKDRLSGNMVDKNPEKEKNIKLIYFAHFSTRKNIDL